MVRFRLATILATMALGFSGCLSPAPPDGAGSEIGEVQSPSPLDETAATDPAVIAPAEPAPAELLPPPDPQPVDPCPCTDPVCRPACKNP